jgi:hypothetical protein
MNKQVKKQETEFDKHYGEMYKLAKYMGTEDLFHELYLSTFKLNTNRKTKENKNGRKRNQ